MRKSKSRQKNEAGRQLDLFNRQAEELVGAPADGISTGCFSRVELLSLLERQRTLTGNLLERIVDYENLERAYKQVKRNGGSSGIDGMEVSGLQIWLESHINELREDILTERYEGKFNPQGRDSEAGRWEKDAWHPHGKRPPHPAGHSSEVKSILRAFV